MNAVMLLSGGIDSSTLLYYLLDKGYEVYALTFYYGQKHSKEIESAEKSTKAAKVQHLKVDISTRSIPRKLKVLKNRQRLLKSSI